MTRPEWGRRTGTVLATIGVLVGLGLALAAGPAAAGHDTEANFTIVLPEDTDYLPGSHEAQSGQNGYNASLEFRVVGGEAFDAAGAPEGLSKATGLEFRLDGADFSECDATQNAKLFGADRGNNRSGTATDEDLIQYRQGSGLSKHGVSFSFFTGSSLAGPDGENLSLAPDDEILLAIGVGSNAGPCIRMPTEPGWYQGTAVLTGENSDGESVTIELESHYFPVCEGCHEQRPAYETLGPPPGQPTLTPLSTPTPTATEAMTGTAASPDTDSDGAGPGFGPVVALVALLGAALLVRR